MTDYERIFTSVCPCLKCARQACEDRSDDMALCSEAVVPRGRKWACIKPKGDKGAHNPL